MPENDSPETIRVVAVCGSLRAESYTRQALALALQGAQELDVETAMIDWVLPDEVSIPEAWRQFDDEGRLTDRDLNQRARKLGRQVARFAYLHTSEQAQAFLRAWEEASSNPGGE